MIPERSFASATDHAVVPYVYPRLTACDERGRCATLTVPVARSDAALLGFGVVLGVAGSLLVWAAARAA